MQVQVITPDKKVFEGEAISAAIGSFEILNDHAPLVSALQESKISIRTTEGTEEFRISGGVVEVLNNQVSVLVESLID